MTHPAPAPPTLADLIVERAYSGDKFIGFRLTIAGTGGGCLLVWADQSLMAGFRVGGHFVPGMDETITYKPCTVVEQP